MFTSTARSKTLNCYIELRETALRWRLLQGTSKWHILVEIFVVFNSDSWSCGLCQLVDWNSLKQKGMKNVTKLMKKIKKKMFVLCIFKLTCGSWRHYKCMNKYTLYNKRHLNCSKLTYTLQSWRWKIKHYLMWNLTCFIFCQKDKEVVQPGNKRRSSRSGLTEYERKVTFSFGCKFSILHVR